MVKQGRVILLELRATQSRDDRVEGARERLHSLGHIADEAAQNIGRGHTDGLEGEAHGIVALEQSLGVEDAAGQAGDVDAGKGVGLARVAAEDEQAGQVAQGVHGVEGEGGETELITDSAAVPLKRRYG